VTRHVVVHFSADGGQCLGGVAGAALESEAAALAFARALSRSEPGKAFHVFAEIGCVNMVCTYHPAPAVPAVPSVTP
jgi:hypothetical protein